MKQEKVAIIGLGYVGLPLAVEFGKIMPAVGFDIDKNRINELKSGHDRTLECDKNELARANQLTYSFEENDLKGVTYFIITVPTPVDEFKQPDLRPLVSASKTVGSVLEKGAVVIYESTVYPGVTEDEMPYFP